MKTPTVLSIKSVDDDDKRIDLVNRITDVLVDNNATVADALNILTNVYCNQLFHHMVRDVPSGHHMIMLAKSISIVEFIMLKWLTNPTTCHFVRDLTTDIVASNDVVH